ncbi:hypothetical protein D8M04_07275 [Oceanobacillus piezotolerans]|uniref:PPM-type phosphatase domain-containing protein n=1 Tax=Oceanobacillus piezotolerans TaxID=2448030 RepID=A0A498DDE6_9BACI|nr:hypothetical protein [Oceanobacillus piezotolerans]RLL46987.1 hypothetical protein D8M04_07275 [Oceanobacillus piezotolerans]
MGLRLIELFHQGKKDREDLCEDMYVFNDHFVAVIDGATNVWGTRIKGKTPGRLAAEVIKSSIESISDEKIGVEDLISYINTDLKKVYHEYGILEDLQKNRTLAPTASLAVYSHFHQEIWQIGDCQALIDGQMYKHEKEIDFITANARSLFLEAELKKGVTIESLMVEDTGWEFIKPLIQQQYYLQNETNSQYGFEVIDGFDIHIPQVKRVKVPANAKEIVLASDGYPFLKPTLEKSEARLQEILKNDPLCIWEYKCTKGLQKGNISFDDRVYLRFERQD